MKTEKIQHRLPTEQEIESELERVRDNRRYRSALASTIRIIVTAAAISVLIATFLLSALQVQGSSMSPTLENGQIVLVFQKNELQQGELTAFYYGEKLLIKRCIAGPGQWVNIDEEGNVYVNDELLDEPYVSEKSPGESDIEFPYQVPENRWFMMGDNRSVSLDSRSNEIGCIAQEQILGKVAFRVWPLDKLSVM